MTVRKESALEAAIRENQVEVSADSAGRLFAGHIRLATGKGKQALFSTPYVYVSSDLAIGSMRHLVAVLRRGNGSC